WQTQSVDNTFASDLLPGFSLHLTHDLWTGPAGLATSSFDPFLTNVAASFSITGATLRGLASLVGLGRAGGPPTSAPGAPAGAPGEPGGPGALPLGAGGGRGFTLAVSYTSSRPRPHADTTGALTPFVTGPGGRRQM